MYCVSLFQGCYRPRMTETGENKKIEVCSTLHWGAESKKQKGLEPSSVCFSGNMRALPVVLLLHVDATGVPHRPMGPGTACNAV